MSDVCLQVFLTPTHLAIVMEYAAGGELFGRICSAGRFSEDEVEVLPFFTFVYLFIFSISFSFTIHFSTDLLSGFLESLCTSGKIFLPTANIWCQLLPFHGITFNFLFHCLKHMLLSCCLSSLHGCLGLIIFYPS